jgi:hypothetical protein
MQPTDATNLHWKTRPNEQITISETHSETMPGVNFTLDLVNEAPPKLTFQMGVSGKRTFTVTAHFSGTANEECLVTVSGSLGGEATKGIDQPLNSSFDHRTFTFIVGN